MTLPPFVTHNAGWKLLAIVMAVLAWLTLHSGVQQRLKEGQPQEVPGRPVGVLTQAADDSVYQVDPSVVDVVLSGSTEARGRLRPEEVRAFVDLRLMTDARELRRPVEVLPPDGLTVEEVTPREVTVRRLPADPSK